MVVRLCLLHWDAGKIRRRGGGFGVCLTKQFSLNHGVCLDPKYITAACGMVAEMVESLPSVLALGHKRNSSTPAFLTSVLKNIIISLARLPLVNSYTRVPPLVSLVIPLQKTKITKMPRQPHGLETPRG